MRGERERSLSLEIRSGPPPRIPGTATAGSRSPRVVADRDHANRQHVQAKPLHARRVQKTSDDSADRAAEFKGLATPTRPGIPGTSSLLAGPTGPALMTWPRDSKAWPA